MANLLTGPVRRDTDLVMTGSDSGDEHVHVVFSGLGNTPAVSATGSASSSHDGTTFNGIPKAPEPCADALPRPPQLHIDARIDGHGADRRAIVQVTASVAGAGPNEGHVDTRPVADATIALGTATAQTDAVGQATLAVPGTEGRQLTVTAIAGQTLKPSSIHLDSAD